MASLDTSFILGLLIIVVVGFFAYQWVSKRAGASRPSTLAPVATTTAVAVEALASPAKEASGTIPGQTAQETASKEPLQQRVPANHQQPIPTSSFPGAGSAQFESTLRHPEQLFHQPSGMAANPHIQQSSDLPSGRASQFSQSAPGQQGYSPEMTQNGGGMLLAQNNGLLMGNSVMAFDSVSMDPMGSGLTAF
jgi:hypothetical protein